MDIGVFILIVMDALALVPRLFRRKFTQIVGDGRRDQDALYPWAHLFSLFISFVAENCNKHSFATYYQLAFEHLPFRSQ
jgi:hypothetical protein